MPRRAIEQIFIASPITEGAGVKLRRAFGHAEAPLCDPFLLLDDFRADSPKNYIKGFPWHPHRGIETITYVIDGSVEHEDSLGNKGVINAGEVQWMTAGSGIIHQEMPKGDEKGRMGGFQLWANLPAANKMDHPAYREINVSDIPEVETDSGARVKIIAGRIKNKKGPVTDVVTAPEYLDCSVPSGVEFIWPVASGRTALIYVMEGNILIGSTHVEDGAAVLFTDGEEICIDTPSGPARFLLFTGNPVNEQIAWRGPIVMNTEAELDQAFSEFSEGRFIKHS